MTSLTEAKAIECEEMVYLDIDEDIVEYEMVDMIQSQEGLPKAIRVRTGIYKRTETPELLGYFEYELLGWKPR